MRNELVAPAAYWHGKGVSPGHLQTLIRRGDLVRLRRGVYATRAAVASGVGDPARAHALQVAAARAIVGRAGAASHHSAALLHGLDLLKRPSPETVTLTRSSGKRISTADGVTLYRAALPETQVVKAQGTVATTVARTVVDLARTGSFMEGVVVADCALRLGKTTKRELADVARACQRWPGSDQARRVIGFSDGRAESVFESAARVVFDAFRLDPPDLQVKKAGPGFSYRVDFYWEKYRTIAECDGLGKYSTKADIIAQFRRDRLLRDGGDKIVHLTWRELFDTPDLVIGRVRNAFAARSAV